MQVAGAFSRPLDTMRAKRVPASTNDGNGQYPDASGWQVGDDIADCRFLIAD
jgi:hypothetical protein